VLYIQALTSHLWGKKGQPYWRTQSLPSTTNFPIPMASGLAEMEDSDLEPTGTTHTATESDALTRTPRTHVDSKPLPTDSLVTINLSETGRTSTSTAYRESSILSAPEADLDDTPKRQTSVDMVNGLAGQEEAPKMSRGSVTSDTYQVVEWTRSRTSTERGESFSDGSDRSIEVDWDELDKTEEREDADAESDEVRSVAYAILQVDTNNHRPPHSCWLASSKKIMPLRAIPSPDTIARELNHAHHPCINYGRLLKNKVHAPCDSHYCLLRRQ